MPLYIQRNDIVKMKTDAIVNATNEDLTEGIGVCSAIYAAAGREQLEEACRKVGGITIGEAAITPGFDLSARYIIHTAGPVWYDGRHGEEELLRSCFRSCLALVKQYGLKSIAFPLISSGNYGYPMDQAIMIAMDEIGRFVIENEVDAYVVVYNKKAFRISEKLFKDVQSYIDDNLVIPPPDPRRLSGLGGRSLRQTTDVPKAGGILGSRRRPLGGRPKRTKLSDVLSDENTEGIALECQCADAAEEYAEQTASESAPSNAVNAGAEMFAAKTLYEDDSCGRFGSDTLEDILRKQQESFSDMLFRLIDASGRTDPDVYKKANMDRKLFSKIRSNPQYRPSKHTVEALCISLELDIDTARDLMAKAGYAFSDSDRFDLIIRFYIERGFYNIFEINDTLFFYTEDCLGA